MAELTYATPATPARCKHPVRHELGACRKFTLMHPCVQLCADSLHIFLDDRLVRPEP